jgi:hypothetical protein
MAEEITVATISVVVAVVSATLGYFFTKEKERQAELRKAKQDIIEDRASIYPPFMFQLMDFTKRYVVLGIGLSFRIYDLQKKLDGIPISDESDETTKMRQTLSADMQAFEKQNETYEAINRMVNSKLYRFSGEVNWKWDRLKEFYMLHNQSPLHIDRLDKTKKEVEAEFHAIAFDLFESLANEYNDSVYPEYVKLFGEGSEHLILNSVDVEAFSTILGNKQKE